MSISHKYLSLLSNQSHEKLIDIKTQKASTLSSISILSTIFSSSVALEIPVRVGFKIRELEFDIDHIQTYKDGLVEAHAMQKLEKKELLEALRAVEDVQNRLKEEFVVLKRQRKIIEEDIEERLSIENIEKAYIITISSQVRLRQEQNQTNRFQTKTTQRFFQSVVETRYDVVKYDRYFTPPLKMLYCMVTKRWWPFSEVKAVNIVPKLLQSEELSYLFGAGDVPLSDPRNGKFVFRLSVDPIAM